MSNADKNALNNLIAQQALTIAIKKLNKLKGLN